MVRWMQAHRRLLIVGIILAFCSAKTQGEVKLKPCFATEKTVLPSPFLRPKLKRFVLPLDHISVAQAAWRHLDNGTFFHRLLTGKPLGDWHPNEELGSRQSALTANYQL